MRRVWLILVVIGAAQAQPVPRATFDEWMRELSNWGRWGPQDQLGAVNLITPEVRRRAVATVKDGFSVSLSRDADTAGHTMNVHGAQREDMFAQDTFTFRFHGATLTHLDTMAHMLHGETLYNGYSRLQVNAQGAQVLNVAAYKQGFVSRGVLMDIPRLKNVPYLDVSTPISPADLDAWEKQASVTVRPGDIVFIRTGRWTRRAEKGNWDTDAASAGLHASCARWLKARDVAIVGSDAHAELMPSPVAGVAYPLHALLLTAMGVPMLDNCDLEALSRAAAERKRWEFLLTAAPIPVPKGTGSPINPIATF